MYEEEMDDLLDISDELIDMCRGEMNGDIDDPLGLNDWKKG